MYKQMSQYLTSLLSLRRHARCLLDFPSSSRYNQRTSVLQEVLKPMTSHTGFTAFFFPYQSFAACPALVDNGGRDPQAYNLSSQGSTPLHHPCLHLYAVSNAWGNAIRTGAVSFVLGNTVSGYLCRRVTPDSVSDPRLLFMHNFKRPFFPKYDMPEMYDLARKNSSVLKKVTLPADTCFFLALISVQNPQCAHPNG